MKVRGITTDGDGCCSSFTPSNQSFDSQDGFHIGLARFFLIDSFTDLVGQAIGLFKFDFEELIVIRHQLGDPKGVMVEDSDVAAGHVGDVDFVFIIVESNQRAAHTDNIIVRMRTEANNFLRFGARRMVVNGVEHPSKNFLRNRFGGTVVAQQLMEIMGAEIVGIEFQQRLASLGT